MPPKQDRDSGSQVVQDFKEWLEKNDKGQAIAVGAINALTKLIKTSDASTIMELEIVLKNAQEQLQRVSFDGQRSKMIQLTAACELFARHVTRTNMDIGDFNVCKSRIIERGEGFAQQADYARDVIAKHALPFFRDGMSILIHGYSNVVLNVLSTAARAGIRFKAICTEGRPDCDGRKTAEALQAAGVPTELLLDPAVAYIMREVDLVLTGAQGVCESGGIINKIGTYQVSVLAKEAQKPLYVAAESYKFCRLYPLSPTDLPDAEKEPAPVVTDGIKVRLPPSDFTPPHHISLLLTDLGILTPSAVSDELIKLYY